MTVRKIAFLCVLILASISACGGPDIVCTPPPCKEDEVYYCPGKCPGGCGTQCATPTLAPPTHTPEPHPTTGLGVTRTDAARPYQFLEFAFELTTDEQGQEHHIGTISDNLAIVELIGPEEDITSASVLVEVPKLPTENQSARTVVYLTTLLTVAAEDWEEGTGWLNDNWNNTGESRTTYANLEVVLVIIPENDMTTVEFTISAK